LGLIPSLTVLENWTICEIALSGNMHLNWNVHKTSANDIFKKYGFEIKLDETVSNLGPVQKAMLAILRAVEDIKSNRIAVKKKRGLLILDEPTVFLPRSEVDVLFTLVRSIAAEGISVMFVSHDLDEVMELTDSFTVLRDGRNVGGGITSEVSKDDIIEIILGKKLDVYRVQNKKKEEMDHLESIRVRGIEGNIVKPSNIEVRKGEVVGITGLVGSGFEEIPYLLFGSNSKKEGLLEMDGKTYDLAKFSPNKAVKANMALIPADRANHGAIGSLTVQDNMMMQVLGNFRPMNLRHKLIRKKSEKLIEQYEIHPEDPMLGFGQLSGGNQQKVLLAKWIQESPEVLILHEPTQGVDVGARQQLYRHIEKAAQKGSAVICCSSDYEQLEQICDRVLIMVKGKIVKELTGEEISKEKITQLCYESEIA
jgi:ribose transport system ATP-binding protein